VNESGTVWGETLIVCRTCGGGPYIWGSKQNMMHWYDTGHCGYDSAPEGAVENLDPDAWKVPK
jgi:hypothetical protein